MAMSENGQHPLVPTLGDELDYNNPSDELYWHVKSEPEISITLVNPSGETQFGYLRIVLVDEDTKEKEYEKHLNIVMNGNSASTFNYSMYKLPSTWRKRVYVSSDLNQKMSDSIIVG